MLIGLGMGAQARQGTAAVCRRVDTMAVPRMAGAGPARNVVSARSRRRARHHGMPSHAAPSITRLESRREDMAGSVVANNPHGAASPDPGMVIQYALAGSEAVKVIEMKSDNEVRGKASRPA